MGGGGDLGFWHVWALLVVSYGLGLECWLVVLTKQSFDWKERKDVLLFIMMVSGLSVRDI